ncbi:MAG: pyrroline-5-carboxylate reductase [Frankiaceae bacterium]|nr:pyrroline-5-carboxylate reductase [Frankiaceae bacterium]
MQQRGAVLAIIGVGKMGEALLAGVRRAGWPADDLRVVDAAAGRAEEVGAAHGVAVLPDAAAAAGADAVVVAVKPADAPQVARLLGQAARGGAAPLVISLVAGVPIALFERLLPAGSPVVRVMPNTPAVVGQGMTAISPGAAAGAEHLGMARRIFGSVGEVVQVPEAQLDAVTAISGSGPAYVFLLAEALADAGAALGLDPQVAAALSRQTIAGAGAMLRESPQHPAQLRQAVTSPGGTTAAALRIFAERDLAGVVRDAAAAAAARGAELGEQYGS